MKVLYPRSLNKVNMSFLKHLWPYYRGVCARRLVQEHSKLHCFKINTIQQWLGQTILACFPASPQPVELRSYNTKFNLLYISRNYTSTPCMLRHLDLAWQSVPVRNVFQMVFEEALFSVVPFSCELSLGSPPLASSSQPNCTRSLQEG